MVFSFACQMVFVLMLVRGSVGIGGTGFWPDVEICLPLGHDIPSAGHLWTAENAGCPQWHISPEWRGRGAFVEKAKAVEDLAERAAYVLGRTEAPTQGELQACGLPGDTPWVARSEERGFARSRIEDDVEVGSTQFSVSGVDASTPWVDRSRGGDVEAHSLTWRSWPGGFVEHYVENHGVLPAAFVRRSILKFDIEAFRLALDAMTACVNSRGQGPTRKQTTPDEPGDL